MLHKKRESAVKISLLALTVMGLICSPAYATQKTDAFDYFMSVKDKNPDTAAMALVESLNKYTRDSKSVDQIGDDPDFSPDFASDAPLMLKNFKMFLQQLQAKGYGAGKFERWHWIYAIGWCEQRNIVFYTSVLHGNKKADFGFHESMGQSLVTHEEIVRMRLNSGCD